MYLKRLEMVGFKSFADRSELEFVPGVTAIVGPNGSGKSNVTDGIRWVLGSRAPSCCAAPRWRMSSSRAARPESRWDTAKCPSPWTIPITG